MYAFFFLGDQIVRIVYPIGSLVLSIIGSIMQLLLWTSFVNAKSNLLLD